MYSYHAYGAMLRDTRRVEAFREAIDASVGASDVVLDLGAGPGLFSVIAARRGARCVYAVDPSPYVALTAEAARGNGVSACVHVFRELSTHWTPDQSITVVIHDLRSVIPCYVDSMRTLIDARRRLAPAARFIPRRDRLCAALLSVPELRDEFVDVWTRCDPRMDASVYAETAVHGWYRVHVGPDRLASDTHVLGTLEYESELSIDLRVSTSWRLRQPGRIDGVLVWFEAELTDQVTYDSGPGNASSVYGQAFFPFRASMDLIPGDRVDWALSALDGGKDYLWQWTTRFESARAGFGTDGRLEMRQGAMHAPLVRDRLASRLGEGREEGSQSCPTPSPGPSAPSARPSVKSRNSPASAR